MTGIVSLLLVASLVAFLVAHASLVCGLARRVRWWRVLLAALVVPLAALWGWEVGFRRRTFVWLGALALYALGVALA